MTRTSVKQTAQQQKKKQKKSGKQQGSAGKGALDIVGEENGEEGRPDSSSDGNCCSTKLLVGVALVSKADATRSAIDQVCDRNVTWRPLTSDQGL